MARRDVEEADWLARVRTMLFGLMAVAFVLAGLANPPIADDPIRSVGWGVLAVLMLVNTTGIGRGGILHRPAVRRLLEDETTREHRRTSHVAGFWAMTACALLIWLLGDRVTLSIAATMQVIVTAGICAALISFSVQEWMAMRDA